MVFPDRIDQVFLAILRIELVLLGRVRPGPGLALATSNVCKPSRMFQP